ncbi:MAG: hypoxanthine phosphoribosyltransferase [Cryomorphaceae bacterium]
MIQVRDKEFEVYISDEQIQSAILEVSARLNADYTDKNPLFICVLNGAFMFFSDLLKHFNGNCEVGFIKATSYEGMQSTGEVQFQESGILAMEGRDVIVVEDIVDTGKTLHKLYAYLSKYTPKSVRVCTLLFKKEAYKESLPIDYVCFETENKFLLGYGLDYDGLGRNLSEVYILKD